MAPLWQLSAAQLVAGYGNGNFSPVDALQACLERTAACQPLTNAFVDTGPGCAQAAHAAAQASARRWATGSTLSALDGVPVSLKDNLHAAGLPTTWGSRLLNNYMPAADELPVARLRAAGMVIFGKTNLPEFAMQGYTHNSRWGTTRNPWNPALTPGGSSGGAVAAVASGCGPIALATDGGGSIRRPASHTGLVGFKPSADCVARADGLPELFLDHEVAGPIGRSVADVALVMQVLAPALGVVPEARPARILFIPTFAAHPVDPHIARLTRLAARQFADLGHTVKEAARFDLAEEVNSLWPTLSNTGFAWLMDRAAQVPEFQLQPGASPDLSLCMPALQEARRLGQAASANTFFALLTAVNHLKLQLDRLFEQHDFLLTPAAAALPWPADEIYPPDIAGLPVGPRGHAIFTGMANAAGLPAVALPCGMASGLPVGLQLVGRQHADLALLALAQQFETAHPQTALWNAQGIPA